MLMFLSYGSGEFAGVFAFLLLILGILFVAGVAGFVSLIHPKFGCGSAVALTVPLVIIPFVLWDGWSVGLVFITILMSCVAIQVFRLEPSKSAKQAAMCFIIGVCTAALVVGILGSFSIYQY